MFTVLLLLAAPTIEAARGQWAAVKRGNRCEAISQSVLQAPKGQSQPFVTISFDHAGPRLGQFAFRFKRQVRGGSSPLLAVGDRSFQLVSRGQVAWSRDPAQEGAILDAMRVSTYMKVDARDESGRRMVDRYSLVGAPTAIDAAAACAARVAKR
jgi:hypothetical protein